MAQIYQAINVKKVVEDFDIVNFVETGTGAADSISHVIGLELDISAYSIEVMEQLYNSNVDKLKDVNNLHLKLGYTNIVLPEILKEIRGNTLFFHDAHFPGADFGFSAYDSEKDNAKRIPLETELRIVKENKDTSNDVFALDDLRIYLDGPYQGGNWDDRAKSGGNGIDFVYELFKETHTIIKSYVQQGFLILFPLSMDIHRIDDYVIGEDWST